MIQIDEVLLNFVYNWHIVEHGPTYKNGVFRILGGLSKISRQNAPNKLVIESY